MPKNLPSPKTNAKLVLKVEIGGVTISQNEYDVLVAAPEWAAVPAMPPNPNFWMIDANESQPDAVKIRDFVTNGGNVLMLHPKSFLSKLYPDAVKRYVPKEGEIVTMRVAESPVFDGIDPLDLAWFGRGRDGIPQACFGVYELAPGAANVTALANYCGIHAYLQNSADISKYTGTPLLEIRSGKGRVVASEMCLEAGDEDPVPGRLLSNLIKFTASGQTSSPAP
jgi:hypothetical protein